MAFLMITIKWNEGYGYDSNDIKFLKYMKSKDFVIIKKDNQFCSTEEVINIYKDMIKNPDNYFDIDFYPKLVVGKTYFFNNRLFYLNDQIFYIGYFTSK